MLSRTDCPHTGIVNFFDADPFLAIGSVVKAGAKERYHWRCYLGQEPNAGSARDRRTAERCLVSHYSRLVGSSDDADWLVELKTDPAADLARASL